MYFNGTYHSWETLVPLVVRLWSTLH